MPEVTRVMMTWNRPHHLSDSEAESWTLNELRRLWSEPSVDRVTLSHVSAGKHHPPSWDWVCELHLISGMDAADFLDAPACREWLHDLRSLGMHPTVAILAASATVE
jgi:hypothetical protein